ncbi:hypothetical protein [Terasakiella pusilla]|uniref:hypothetical protein n=1 Tax=Terasakiella pusilla TaxID=64973 RepID=UPI00048DB332|nr:hypothetical protein [Terasakiella pusilla]
MKSSISYINNQTTPLLLHPSAEPAAIAWEKLDRHWKSSEFTKADISAILENTTISVVKKDKAYLFFSNFEAVRLIKHHHIKKVTVRLYEKIPEHDIRRISVNYLGFIKLYSLKPKTGLASLQRAASSYLAKEFTIDHFDTSLQQVKNAAPALGVTHKQLRTQIQNLKGKIHD